MQKQTEKGVFNCVWEFILKKHKINIYFNFNFICFSKKISNVMSYFLTNLMFMIYGSCYLI